MDILSIIELWNPFNLPVSIIPNGKLSFTYLVDIYSIKSHSDFFTFTSFVNSYKVKIL